MERSRLPVYKFCWTLEGPKPSRPPDSLLLRHGPVRRWGPRRSVASPLSLTHGRTPDSSTPMCKQSSKPASNGWIPHSLPPPGPRREAGPRRLLPLPMTRGARLAFFTPLKSLPLAGATAALLIPISKRDRESVWIWGSFFTGEWRAPVARRRKEEGGGESERSPRWRTGAP